MQPIPQRPPFPIRRLLALILLGSSAIFSPSTQAATNVNPPAILLAQTYQAHVDPGLYLVSEKLDGVRAIWDGSNLRFRSGNIIHAPAWFTAALPKRALDGELWMGRRSFERLSAAVRRNVPQDEEWKQIRYQLYELPDGSGSFEERVAQLQRIVKEANLAWLQVLPQQRVTDRNALRQMLQQLVKDGGEGLMLHRADALWQTGRSDALLKYKPQLDAEAQVVAHEMGQGKYQGMLGALVVQTADGQRFRLGTGLSDQQRRNPPPVGSSVTYRYRDLTANGVPRFASFVRVREAE